MKAEKLPTWKIVTRVGVLLGAGLLFAAFVVQDLGVSIPFGTRVLAIAGAVIAVGCAAVNYDVLLRMARGPGAGAGLNFASTIVLAIALLSLVCFISTRRFARLDMTGKRRYSLHSKTERVLRSLDRPVKVTVIYYDLGQLAAMDPQAQLQRWGYEQSVDMLEEFQAVSPKIAVERIDLGKPEEHKKAMEIGARLKTDLPGRCIVFESGDSHDVIPLLQVLEVPPAWQGGMPKFLGESVFYSALTKLTEKEKKVVYFLTGHGERAIEAQAGAEEPGQSAGGEAYSLSKLVGKLKSDNFESKALNLAGQHGIPEDCSVLIVAGPKVPLPEEQVAAIRQYVENRKGSVIIMLDFQSGANLGGLLAEYGVKADTDAVGMVELAYVLSGTVLGTQVAASVPVDRKGYARHPITTDLQNYELEFFQAAPLEILNPTPKPGLAASALLTGMEGSWGEKTLLREMKESKYNAKEDIAGPVIIGAVVEAAAPPGMPFGEQPGKAPGPKLLVLGSSLSFVNAAVENTEANLYVLLNAVNWMAGKAQQTGIPAKDVDINVVTLKSIQLRASRWLVIFNVGFIGVLGITIFLLRRR